MSWRALWVTFALGVCGGVVLFAPAGLWGVALDHFSSGRLALADVSGTVWNGRGKLILQMRSGERLGLGDFAWRMEGSRLFAGELALDLQQEAAGRRGQVSANISSRGSQLRELDLSAPAVLLGQFSPAWMLLAPDGWLHLQSREFVFRAGGFFGEAQASWAPARFLDGVEAGNYVLRMKGESGGRLAGTLSTQGGDLQVSGQVNWQANTGLQGLVRLALLQDGENGRVMPLLRALCAGDRRECELNLNSQ